MLKNLAVSFVDVLNMKQVLDTSWSSIKNTTCHSDISAEFVIHHWHQPKDGEKQSSFKSSGNGMKCTYTI